MERCPNCGYKTPFNWPVLMFMLAFSVVFILWAIGGYQPRGFGWLGLSALFLYSIGLVGTTLRNNRDYEAAKKLRTPVADEVRDRIRSETSQ